MTIFSGHSVISRVYTSRFGNGTARWNLDRSGTKKVSGTRYSTQWKTPQKWTVPYRTVPYHAVEKRQKMSSTIAWHREWAAQLVEDRAAVCPGTGPRFIFFPLSPLSSLSLLILPSPFLSPRLSLPPGTPRPPWRAPPGRGGRGGVERSLVGTPRPARGDGGMWRVGRGREPWERSEAGGVIGNERHLHRSPVSSPTEELRKG